MVSFVKKCIGFFVVISLLMFVIDSHAAGITRRQWDMLEKYGNMFWQALESNAIEEVRIVLDKVAFEGNDEDLLFFVNRSKEGNTPLVVAIKKGYLDMVDLLLDRGALVNEVREQGPLVTAIELRNKGDERLLARGRDDSENSIGIIKMLLAAKASVNECDRDGRTPLMRAVIKRDSDMVRLLLEKKADPNFSRSAQTEKFTVLMCAVRENYDEIAVILAAADANIQTKEWCDNRTALDMARPEMREIIKQAAVVPALIGLGEMATQNSMLVWCIPVQELRSLIGDYLVPFYEQELLNAFVAQEIERQKEKEKIVAATEKALDRAFSFKEEIASIVWNYVPAVKEALQETKEELLDAKRSRRQEACELSTYWLLSQEGIMSDSEEECGEDSSTAQACAEA